MTTTIVSSYFQLPQSKHSHEKYLYWMENMLSINNPMIIFCDSESADTIHKFRFTYMDKTCIVKTTFNEFYTSRYYTSFCEHSKMDYELNVGHNPFLYMIWNEKSHFLKRAIEMNPFQTDYFLWTDIGCFRNTNYKHRQWPNTSSIPNDKILLLSVKPFTETELSVQTLNTLPNFQFDNRIGGTIFGGKKDILLKWHEKYYHMLEHFISINRFIGKDQSIMNSVYLLNKDMCELIQWKTGCYDIWFYLQDYLL
jgi:hypothetical protein